MRGIVVTRQELVGSDNIADDVDLARYSRLHRDGKGLIRQWFERAWTRRDCRPEESFEPFIYAWFALNGWAACVTGYDADYKWRQALSITPTLCSDFSDLVNDSNSPISELAQESYECWPVFKAQEIRRKQAQLWGQPPRQDAVRHYFEAGIGSYAPPCWQRHRDAGEKVPLDWPHTLSVLYRVRCNLFHGEKAIHSEMDYGIVYSAFRLLVHFFDSADYFELHPRRKRAQQVVGVS